MEAWKGESYDLLSSCIMCVAIKLLLLLIIVIVILLPYTGHPFHLNFQALSVMFPVVISFAPKEITNNCNVFESYF